MKMLGGAIGVQSFDVVFCPQREKFVRRSRCHYCNSLDGDYSGAWGRVVCKNRPPIGHTCEEWTLDELVEMLQNEQEKCLEMAREKKD